ncbi:MAG TPA: universal stress protein [Methanotrichaceae archaeon]|nr:universal stress protein [Methanotrichaceae archaeon]HQF16240.1 universal stress protein [Methanotrichaceae archaeon]HQI90012.1 universal stress protein [Methanotrichaceae archaeon]HQJ27964.1 universal stress protein [Methanotrichaceae archaeon]
MFEKILVPVDFSTHSAKSAQCAAQFPGVKEMVLLHVMVKDPLARIWDPVEDLKKARSKLDAMGGEIAKSGVSVKTRVETLLGGDAYHAVQRVASEEGVSMVVMGARGKGAVKSLLLGSVSRGMLTYGKEHLLIMRYKSLEGDLHEFCPQIFFRVLVPTDFSEPSIAAINFISKLPGINELSLAHVVASGESQSEIDVKSGEASKTLNAMADELAKSGLRVTVHVSSGDEAKQINAMAETIDASLIALSSIGSGSPHGVEIGRTAYDTANQAKRPVLILRASRGLKYQF